MVCGRLFRDGGATPFKRGRGMGVSRAWLDEETAPTVRPGARARPGTGSGRWVGRGARFVGAVDAPAAGPRDARARARGPAGAETAAETGGGCGFSCSKVCMTEFSRAPPCEWGCRLCAARKIAFTAVQYVSGNGLVSLDHLSSSS